MIDSDSSVEATKATSLKMPLLDQLRTTSIKSLQTKVYAESRPKILLEVMSARTATVMLVFTYLIFALCFAVDIANTAKSFTSNLFEFTPEPCTEQATMQYQSQSYSALRHPHFEQLDNSDPTQPSAAPTRVTSGQQAQTCYVEAYSWNVTIFSLRNIISAQFDASQTNFSALTNWTYASQEPSCAVAKASYDVTLWACYQPNGCSGFSDMPSDNAQDTWHESLELTSQSIEVNLCRLRENGILPVQIFVNTFQNQESIPTNGVVKSYFVQLTVYSNPYGLLVPADGAVADSISFQVRVVNRPSHGALSDTAVALLTICLYFSIAALLIYCRYMLVYQPNPNRWLPEQQWTVANLFVLALYLNPVFCAIYWPQQTAPSSSAAYASYTLDQLGQCGFFLVWLLFADPLGRRELHWTVFYLPKIGLVLSIFLCYITVLTLQFPSQVMSDRLTRSSVQAVVNWPSETQDALVAFSVMYLLLQWIWVLVWFTLLYRTSKRLAKLPYMSTRYLQLSSRFFWLQAVLITLYYVVSYGTAIYYIADSEVVVNGVNTALLADNINTMFREQTQMFGKLLFLTAYALVLALLFLPASFAGAEDSITAKLAATYVIGEAELKLVVKSRRKAIRRLNRMQQSFLENVTAYKPFVFCVDLALAMCEVSNEVYYDPPGSLTSSGLGHEGGQNRSMDLQALGYELVTRGVFTDDEHDTFCIIARHRDSRRLLIAFRGTSSRKNWNNNVKLTQRPVDLLHNSPVLPPMTFSTTDGACVSSTFINAWSCSTAARVIPTSPPGHPHPGLNSFPMDEDFDEDDEEEDEPAAPKHASLRNLIRRATGVLGRSHDRDKDTPGSPNTTAIDRLQVPTDEPSSPVGRDKDKHTLHDRIDEGQRAISSGVQTFADTMLGVTGTAVGAVTATASAAEKAVMTVAEQTPGLKTMLIPWVHTGFWEAYSSVRSFVHSTMRRELGSEPADVVLTGHSLGAALASLCAADLAIHTVEPLNRIIRDEQSRLKEVRRRDRERAKEKEVAFKGSNNSQNSSLPTVSALHKSDRWPFFARSPVPSASGPVVNSYSYPQSPSQTQPHLQNLIQSDISHPHDTGLHLVHVSMYNFGSPRVGNRAWASLYNRAVPDSFRTTADGDIVPGVPRYGYKHIGTEVLIDGASASGSIIIGPSFIERRLRVQSKASVAAHSLQAYRLGLVSIIDAAVYMAQFLDPQLTLEEGRGMHGDEYGPEADKPGEIGCEIDYVDVALRARSLIEEKQQETRKIKSAVSLLDQSQQLQLSAHTLWGSGSSHESQRMSSLSYFSSSPNLASISAPYNANSSAQRQDEQIHMSGRQLSSPVGLTGLSTKSDDQDSDHDKDCDGRALLRGNPNYDEEKEPNLTR